MCKKVLLSATLAVVAAVFVIGGPRLASRVRYWKQQFRCAVEDRIPPEQEIGRLRMEVDNLAREDEKAYDRVARQGREVKKLQARVDELKKNLSVEEKRIRDMRSRVVAVKDDTESMTELRQAAKSFKVQEAKLTSLQEQLAAKKEDYDLNRQKLFDRELVREQLRTELQRLETALTREHQAQAREKNTLDDSSYLRIQDDVNSIREKIELMRDKRQLKGEVQTRNSGRAAEKRREEDAMIDKFLETRFGDKGADGQ